MDTAAPHGSHTGPAHVGTERARAEKFSSAQTGEIKKNKEKTRKKNGEYSLLTHPSSKILVSPPGWCHLRLSQPLPVPLSPRGHGHNAAEQPRIIKLCGEEIKPRWAFFPRSFSHPSWRQQIRWKLAYFPARSGSAARTRRNFRFFFSGPSLESEFGGLHCDTPAAGMRLLLGSTGCDS